MNIVIDLETLSNLFEAIQNHPGPVAVAVVGCLFAYVYLGFIMLLLLSVIPFYLLLKTIKVSK